MLTLLTAADVFQHQSIVLETRRFFLEIIQVDEQLLPLITEFIAPYEASCVQLSAKIRKSPSNVNALTSTLTPTTTSQILGVLYNDSTLLYCIPSKNLIHLDSAKLISFLYNPSKRIKCISGEAKSSEYLISLLKSKISTPYQINHYNLMTATSVLNPPDKLQNDDEIIRCTENDMETLLPLQKMYMNTEVAPYGKTVTDAEASISLRQILKNQLCLAVFSDGEPVAKANTNAIGINWIQLGGIFTHPLYRRNGYAWQLISAICRRTSNSGKSTALFVKDINVPAIELYKHLGFKTSGQYIIAYF